LYTHTSVPGPPLWLGPSGTITRLASTPPADTLRPGSEMLFARTQVTFSSVVVC
jgi:hypothetical protein